MALLFPMVLQLVIFDAVVSYAVVVAVVVVVVVVVVIIFFLFFDNHQLLSYTRSTIFSKSWARIYNSVATNRLFCRNNELPGSVYCHCYCCFDVVVTLVFC